jgi:hypothetical protein
MAIPSSNRNSIQTQIKVNNATHASTADSSTTAISASYALTASYAMNGGGGGGGIPGGSTGDIQFNNGTGGFGGDGNFNYNISNQTILFQTNADFKTTSVSTDSNSNISLYNQYNQPFSHGFKSYLIQWNVLIPSDSTESIISFDVHPSDKTYLNILGFKCDYSLSLLNGSNTITGTRIGTLYGAWDYDEGIDPSLNQIYISGDSSLALEEPQFNLRWNGSKIELYLNSNRKDLIFSGLFTVFVSS